MLTGLDPLPHRQSSLFASSHRPPSLPPIAPRSSAMALSPLHLPELVEVIARYLKKPDLIQCLQVSKSWHHTFAPFLYQRLHHGYGRNRVLVWEGVQKHGHHTRTLWISSGEFPDLSLFGPGCTHLTTLRLGPLHYMRNTLHWWPRLWDLVEHNPLIHTLTIQVDRCLCTALFGEHNFLRHLPALRDLTIRGDVYSANGPNGVFEAILECGSQLTSLSYQAVWGNSKTRMNDESTQGQEQWPRLLSLTIDDATGFREEELLKRCPNLTTLKTTVDFMNLRPQGYKALQPIARHFSSKGEGGGDISRLRHLEISNTCESRDLDALNQLLKVDPSMSSQLQTLSLHLRGIPCMTLDLLAAHHARCLRKLVLDIALGVSGYQLGMVLSRTCQLRHVEVSLSQEGWLQGLMQSSWACGDVRTLHLTICSQTSSRLANYLNDMDMSTTSTTTTATTTTTTTMTMTSSSNGFMNERTTRTTESDGLLQRQFWMQVTSLTNLELLQLDTDKSCYSIKTLSVVQEDIEQLCELRYLRELRLPGLDSNDVMEQLHRRRPRLLVVI